MQWKTSACDCLYLNWALPRQALPQLPGSMRYEVHEAEGRQVVFVSALLFHVRRLQPMNWPGPRVSFPQLSFRAYAIDRQGVPSVVFLQLLMPWWVVPFSRWLGRQPAHAAHLHFARPTREMDRESWCWKALAPQELRVVARPGSGRGGSGPELGSWAETVAYFRSRSRAYATDEKRLRELEADETSTDPAPLAATVERSGLLRRFLPAAPGEVWETPHSAWLCPEIPVILELGTLRRRVMVPSLSAPTTGG